MQASFAPGGPTLANSPPSFYCQVFLASFSRLLFPISGFSHPLISWSSGQPQPPVTLNVRLSLDVRFSFNVKFSHNVRFSLYVRFSLAWCEIITQSFNVTFSLSVRFGFELLQKSPVHIHNSWYHFQQKKTDFFNVSSNVNVNIKVRSNTIALSL